MEYCRYLLIDFYLWPLNIIHLLETSCLNAYNYSFISIKVSDIATYFEEDNFCLHHYVADLCLCFLNMVWCNPSIVVIYITFLFLSFSISSKIHNFLILPLNNCYTNFTLVTFCSIILMP